MFSGHRLKNVLFRLVNKEFGGLYNNEKRKKTCLYPYIMDLSVRAYNCLKRQGINFISDIIAMSEADLMKVRNLGRRSADEVLEKVQYFINGGKVLERSDSLVDLSEEDLSDLYLFDDL